MAGDPTVDFPCPLSSPTHDLELPNPATTIAEVILRCTRKLLTVIGPALAASPDPSPSQEDWYANLLWFDRRKCLLLTHSGTLFSIFEPDVRAPDLRAAHHLLARLISRELAREELPPGTFPVRNPAELVLAKTADRSILGCMNDMAFLCEIAIGDSGGLARTELAALNRVPAAQHQQHARLRAPDRPGVPASQQPVK